MNAAFDESIILSCIDEIKELENSRGFGTFKAFETWLQGEHISQGLTRALRCRLGISGHINSSQLLGEIKLSDYLNGKRGTIGHG